MLSDLGDCMEVEGHGSPSSFWGNAESNCVSLWSMTAERKKSRNWYSNQIETLSKI